MYKHKNKLIEEKDYLNKIVLSRHRGVYISYYRNIMIVTNEYTPVNYYWFFITNELSKYARIYVNSDNKLALSTIKEYKNNSKRFASNILELLDSIMVVEYDGLNDLKKIFEEEAENDCYGVSFNLLRGFCDDD